jgi:hypothetical protein
MLDLSIFLPSSKIIVSSEAFFEIFELFVSCAHHLRGGILRWDAPRWDSCLISPSKEKISSLGGIFFVTIPIVDA